MFLDSVRFRLFLGQCELPLIIGDSVSVRLLLGTVCLSASPDVCVTGWQWYPLVRGQGLLVYPLIARDYR